MRKNCYLIFPSNNSLPHPQGKQLTSLLHVWFFKKEKKKPLIKYSSSLIIKGLIHLSIF